MVTDHVILDSGPLSLVTNPRRSQQSADCNLWLQGLVNAGAIVYVPEIADYELRRELLRGNKHKGLANLDALASVLEYVPLTTQAMRKAAEFWATAPQRGQPTASDKTIDADMILAGQVATLGASPAVIATTNVGHLNQFVAAHAWNEISA